MLSNVKRKDAEAESMADALAKETASVIRESIRGSSRESDTYDPKVEMVIPAWCRTEVA